MDVPVVEVLAARLRERAGPGALSARVRLASTVGEFCTIASTADVVVASRLHGVILPIVAGTPVVAISYMRKVSRFMADSGMAGRCLDVRQLSSDRLVASTLEALADAVQMRARLAELNRRFRAELSAQYDAVARLAGSVPPARA
jgi:polysaccharide pyruvyl transferase WcaK-like protein